MNVRVMTIVIENHEFMGHIPKNAYIEKLIREVHRLQACVDALEKQASIHNLPPTFTEENK